MKALVEKELSRACKPVERVPGLEDSEFMMRVRTTIARERRAEAGREPAQLSSSPYFNDWDQFAANLKTEFKKD